MIDAAYFKTGLYWPSTFNNNDKGSPFSPSNFTYDINRTSKKQEFNDLLEPFKKNINPGYNMKSLVPIQEHKNVIFEPIEKIDKKLNELSGDIALEVKDVYTNSSTVENVQIPQQNNIYKKLNCNHTCDNIQCKNTMISQNPCIQISDPLVPIPEMHISNKPIQDKHDNMVDKKNKKNYSKMNTVSKKSKKRKLFGIYS